jgi:hypothetical protein
MEWRRARPYNLTPSFRRLVITYLGELLDFVQKTGIGAIPLPPSDSSRTIPSLEQLSEQIEKATAAVFTQHRDVRDFGKVVSDVLMGAGSEGR